MIQRIQSLYLLGVMVVGVLVFFLNPSYAIFKDSSKDKKVMLGYTKTTTSQLSKPSDAGVMVSKTLNFLLIILITLGSGAAIFLYKKMGLQKKVCIYLTLLSVLLLILMFVEYTEQTKQLFNGSLRIWAIIPVAFMAATALAWKDIRRDETLLQSMDRLR